MDGQPGPKGNVVSPRGHMTWLLVMVCGHSPCLAVEVCISWELGQESGHLSLWPTARCCPLVSEASGVRISSWYLLSKARSQFHQEVGLLALYLFQGHTFLLIEYFLLSSWHTFCLEGCWGVSASPYPPFRVKY